MQAVAQWFKLYLVYHFIDKSELKEQFGLLLADATLSHIEQCGIIELSYGRAMRAFHVVGVYLKHRLGVHSGCLCGAKVLVYFFTDSLLCSMTHENTTCERSSRLVVEHILVELVTRTVAHLMVDERVVVDVLCLVGYHATVAPALGTFTFKHHVKTVAGNSVMQSDYIMVET